MLKHTLCAAFSAHPRPTEGIVDMPRTLGRVEGTANNGQSVRTQGVGEQSVWESGVMLIYQLGERTGHVMYSATTRVITLSPPHVPQFMMLICHLSFPNSVISTNTCLAQPQAMSAPSCSPCLTVTAPPPTFMSYCTWRRACVAIVGDIIQKERKKWRENGPRNGQC